MFAAAVCLGLSVEVSLQERRETDKTETGGDPVESIKSTSSSFCLFTLSLRDAVFSVSRDRDRSRQALQQTKGDT